MKINFCIALTLSVLLSLSATAQEKTESKQEKKKPKWTQLFNGKDLSGWTPKIRGYKLGENHGDTFRVVDGLLTVSYDKYTKFDQKFGHLFYKEPFSNYKLRIEYRFIGRQIDGGPGWARRNSGVMIHCQDPETMTKDQNFPVSIEVQLLGGLGSGKRTTLNLCTPGTHVEMDGKLIRRHCISSDSDTYHGEKWVTAEIEVHGGKTVKHLIDGKSVLSYDKPQLDPGDKNAKKLIKDKDQLVLKKGYISLQSESHPIQFRKVEIQKIEVKKDKKAEDKKAEAKKDK